MVDETKEGAGVPRYTACGPYEKEDEEGAYCHYDDHREAVEKLEADLARVMRQNDQLHDVGTMWERARADLARVTEERDNRNTLWDLAVKENARVTEELDEAKDHCIQLSNKVSRAIDEEHTQTVRAKRSEDRNARLREALDYYADDQNYTAGGRYDFIRVFCDRGDRARKALAQETTDE